MTSPTMMAASAVAPCISYISAMAHLADGLADPVLGEISINHVQLCPQHAGSVTADLVGRLSEAYPQTRFRLHASPRVEGGHRHHIMTAANAFTLPEQLSATIRINQMLGADGYSIHAGKASEGNLEQALENTKRLADRFGCRVGIEGLYPASAREEHWLLSSWADYETMLRAGVDYALDLSHLSICAFRSGSVPMGLLRDLLASPHLIEVHVSANDGRRDEHRPLHPDGKEWWLPELHLAHPDAIFFYEGVLVEPIKKGRR